MRPRRERRPDRGGGDGGAGALDDGTGAIDDGDAPDGSLDDRFRR
ncbi:hypothetical protein [Halegenticoccus tardaugens]|nr:hypothetical protein [Halegenticoccus tardaugens]